MHKITLVCSAHRENGLCNAEELLKVLLAIDPEVVFLETRPSDHWAVEAGALKRYRELKECQPVHVDRYDMPAKVTAEIKRDVDRVFDCVAQRCAEYELLEKENEICVNQRGFTYLNSPAFETNAVRMSKLEDETIIETRDQDLIRSLQWWRQAMQGRELQMVGAIYQYCRTNAFDIGVFLVGAAHKAGIQKEVKKYAGAEADLISWKFSYDS